MDRATILFLPSLLPRSVASGHLPPLPHCSGGLGSCSGRALFRPHELCTARQRIGIGGASYPTDPQRRWRHPTLSRGCVGALVPIPRHRCRRHPVARARGRCDTPLPFHARLSTRSGGYHRTRRPRAASLCHLLPPFPARCGQPVICSYLRLARRVGSFAAVGLSCVAACLVRAGTTPPPLTARAPREALPLCLPPRRRLQQLGYSRSHADRESCPELPLYGVHLCRTSLEAWAFLASLLASACQCGNLRRGTTADGRARLVSPLSPPPCRPFQVLNNSSGDCRRLARISFSCQLRFHRCRQGTPLDGPHHPLCKYLTAPTFLDVSFEGPHLPLYKF